MTTTRRFVTRSISVLVLITVCAGGRAQLLDDQLFSRTFRVDVRATQKLVTETGDVEFHSPLRPVGDADDHKALTRHFQQLFAARGVELEAQDVISSRVTGKAMFLNERTGVLFVRASLADLDRIETALRAINGMPAQVSVEAKFAEIPEGGEAVGLNRPVPFRRRERQITVSVITESQYRERLRVLEQQTGVDVITPPNVTTISGRQARIAVEQTKPIFYQTPPRLPKDTLPDADPTPGNKGRLPFPAAYARN